MHEPGSVHDCDLARMVPNRQPEADALDRNHRHALEGISAFRHHVTTIRVFGCPWRFPHASLSMAVDDSRAERPAVRQSGPPGSHDQEHIAINDSLITTHGSSELVSVDDGLFLVNIRPCTLHVSLHRGRYRRLACSRQPGCWLACRSGNWQRKLGSR